VEHNIHINCPNCEKENIIKLSNDIKCKECGESLITEKVYKTKIKPLIGSTTAIIIVGSGLYVDSQYIHSRYPLDVEYKIVRQCSAYEMPYSRYYIKKGTNICICALNKTEKKIDFDEYEETPSKFLNLFEENINECIKQID